MDENESPRKPPFASVSEFVDYFDSGADMGDYLDEMPEAHFDVNLRKRRSLLRIDAELAEILAEIANQQQTTLEALIELWLREKVSQINEGGTSSAITLSTTSKER